MKIEAETQQIRLLTSVLKIGSRESGVGSRERGIFILCCGQSPVGDCLESQKSKVKSQKPRRVTFIQS